MTDETKRQVFQSVGQFVIIVASALIAQLLTFTTYSEFHKTGALDALWQPFWSSMYQAVMAVAGIWGLSKFGPGAPKPGP